MPLYEYECTACHKRVEKRQKFSDAPLTECPHCGGKLERTITAPAVQFKGGGWYADGYGSTKKSSGSGSSSEGSSSSSESSSMPSAPAASTPAASSAPASSAPASTTSTSK